MNKLRETLRLHFECNLSNRQIGKALSLSPSTVSQYIKAAVDAGLEWSVIAKLDDTKLTENLGLGSKRKVAHKRQKKLVDLMKVHTSLKQKGVTRELLHQEYQQDCKHLQSISYTEFCRQYRAFKKTLKPSMRQTHVAGKKTFIDYAGPTIPVFNADTGVSFNAVIFVAVLGASNFTFAEATKTRSLSDWIGSHNRMFTYFGGVTELIIPDNEKSAVTKACLYDPDINPNYAALAAHYGTAVLPTRPYHPKDKAKVEVAVQVVERWIMAKLRHRKFFSLSELNEAITALLDALNDKPFKKLSGTRRMLYNTLDKPALKPLPKHQYEFAIIKQAQVNLDYHVEVDTHFYSVPYRFIGQRVTYRLGENTVELFHEGQSIVTHIRARTAGEATTLIEHMPDAHKRHQQWTPAVFINWSQTVGDHMVQLSAYLIQHKRNPECCYRIQLGFINLAKKYGKPRLEEACRYAVLQSLMSYTHVDSILKSQVDKAPLGAANDYDSKTNSVTCLHKNLRGAAYYSNYKRKPDENTN